VRSLKLNIVIKKPDLTIVQRNKFETELWALLKKYGCDLKPSILWSAHDKFILEVPDSKTIKTLPTKFKHDYFALQQKLINRTI